jgi:hypothetical protein
MSDDALTANKEGQHLRKDEARFLSPVTQMRQGALQALGTENKWGTTTSDRLKISARYPGAHHGENWSINFRSHERALAHDVPFL